MVLNTPEKKEPEHGTRDLLLAACDYLSCALVIHDLLPATLLGKLPYPFFGGRQVVRNLYPH
jgi:hypothetical protein